ncbi:MAG: Spy/CpxP family protein refolding chaperone [Acetobacteraceae bacterium]|nr:Spy/CpxP family protein refolding chaperone [Acetobacteraceae bacterium]
MPRRALAAPLAFALIAVPAAIPAWAQQQGAPSDRKEHRVPGTGTITGVPGVGYVTDSGKGRGDVNHPDQIPTGTPGAKQPFRTGPLEGGGGPTGPSSTLPKQHSDAGSIGAPIMLAQADIQAQSEAPATPPPATAPSPGATAPAAPSQRDMRVQQQLRDLYTQLRITPAEEPQWDGFARTLQANADRMHQLWASRPTGQVSALDDMRNYTRMAQAHAEDMQRLVAAFEPLYTSLSSEQKATADRVFQQAAVRNGRRAPR